jgi:hypothetical protein
MGKLSTMYREEADKVLRQVCLERGMFRFRAWYVYKAVRKFAAFATKPNGKEDKIICTP